MDKERFIIKNSGLIMEQVHRIPRERVEEYGYEDLKQEAYLAALEAIESYQEGKGTKLTSWVYKNVGWKLSEVIYGTGGNLPLTVPRTQRRLYYEVEDKVYKMQVKRETNGEEFNEYKYRNKVMRKVGITKYTHKQLDAIFRLKSIDLNKTYISDSGETDLTWGAMIEDTVSSNFTNDVEIKIVFEDVLEREFKNPYKQMVELHLKGENQKDIGKKLGFSRQGVQHHVNKFKNIMRRELNLEAI